MKNIFLILMFVLTNSCAQKQTNYDGFDVITHNSQITDLHGKWRISALIANTETKEYLLSPQSLDRFENYGNNILINPDQTFISGYSAECGNDCFTTTNGKYKIIDENYICFYLEEIIQSGECSGNSKPNKDLGLYYFKKFDSYYRLLKSSGNLKDDEKNTLYLDLVDRSYEKQGRYINLLTYKSTNKLSSDNEIVSYCLNEKKINDYKIVHSKLYDNDRKKIFLIETNNKFLSIIYNIQDKKVALYDDTIIEKMNKLVDTLKNKSKLLKGTNSKEAFNAFYNKLKKNTIQTFQKDNVVLKIVNTVYFENGVKSITTFYLENNTPVFVEELIDFKDYVKKTEFYIVNWQDSFETSVIVKLGNFGGGSSVSQMKQQFNRIINNK